MANTWRFAMTAGILLRDDFDGSALRRLARQSHNASQTRRLLALAEIYGGGSRDAARIGGVGVQIVRGWVVRFNAKGPDGLLNGKASGAPQHSRRQPAPGVAAGRGGRPHPSRPWRRSLAVDRSRAGAVRGVSPRDLQANAQPGTAKHGFSQALGAAAPSPTRRGSRRRV
jgi:hypothetical protein